jgi:uncharacterized protein YigE (DUF2233 family)
MVAYRDGHVDVRTWNRGLVAGREIAFARQSLPLIVDHGRLNPNLNDSSQRVSRLVTPFGSGAPAPASTDMGI